VLWNSQRKLFSSWRLSQYVIFSLNHPTSYIDKHFPGSQEKATFTMQKLLFLGTSLLPPPACQGVLLSPFLFLPALINKSLLIFKTKFFNVFILQWHGMTLPGWAETLRDCWGITCVHRGLKELQMWDEISFCWDFPFIQNSKVTKKV
jgi:hypothetical protein